MTSPNLPAPPEGKTGWPWLAEPQPVPPTMPDGSPWPKISVVTPSYNQGQYIEETIRSVLLQGYLNLEFIIIDGGSTDSTLDVLHKYEPWLAYWVSEPDRGQSHAVNKGIARATGEFLLWLNADDLLLPGACFTAVRAFRESPSTQLVIGQARVIDASGQVIGELRSEFTTWQALAVTPRNSIRQVATFFDRRLFKTLGGLDERLHVAMDTELLVRFTRQYPPLIIPDILAAFRVQPQAKSATQLMKGYLETDRHRPGILEDSALRRQYRRNSAGNWLSLAEAPGCDTSKRLRVMLYAIKQFIPVVLQRRFWQVFRKFFQANQS